MPKIVGWRRPAKIGRRRLSLLKNPPFRSDAGGWVFSFVAKLGRRNLDGVDFSADDRRAEGKVPGEPAFSGTATANAGVSKHGGRVPGGETPEKVQEINGHRYAYGQPDAADYTAPVRIAADSAKQRF